MDDDRRARIFCIGLNKTGTRSLHEALEILGYRSLHHGGLETLELVERALQEQRPLLTYLDPGYDAFSDILGLTYDFYLADVEYPGSRFILTIRDLDTWLASRRRHVERNRRAAAVGEYTDGFIEVDIDAWTSEYVRHHAHVHGYFADRPDDLLVYDLVGGEGWEPLCRFLDRPVPDAPFPWSNQTQELAR
jgi:Sulfotransferase domain